MRALLFTVITSLAFSSFSQRLTLPKESQKGEITQTIGLSKVSIVYHSPAVRGRTIWGGLVPYDKVWRCGANENTTISFSDPAKVGGHDIPAGTYGLHMIPGKGEWTIILSSNHTSWGSSTYRKREDVLRMSVKPEQLTKPVEWLNYGFMNKEAESAVAYLEWEKLRIPFEIAFDVKMLVVQNIENELRSLPGFGRTGHLRAAQYCLQHNFHHTRALQWADRAMKVNPGFESTSTKAGLLAQIGKEDQAEKLMDRAINSATENELNAYGYELLGKKDVKRAIEIFRKNVERHPKSWNTYDSLAEAYAKDGNETLSAKNYKLALKKDPPENQRSRIEKILK